MPSDTQHEAAIEERARAMWRCFMDKVYDGVGDDTWEALFPRDRLGWRAIAAYDAARSGEREELPREHWKIQVCPSCGEHVIADGMTWCEHSPGDSHKRVEVVVCSAARSGEAEGDLNRAVEAFLLAKGEGHARREALAIDAMRAVLAEHPEPRQDQQRPSNTGYGTGICGDCGEDHSVAGFCAGPRASGETPLIDTHAPIIEGLLTPQELADWQANLTNPETWEKVKRLAEEMLRKLRVEHPETGERETCPDCDGKGDWSDLDSTDDRLCGRCKGSGKIPAPEPLQDDGEREPWTGKRLFDALLHEAERARNPFGRLSSSGKVKWDALAARIEREIEGHPHQDVEPRRLTLTRREIGALLAAGNLSYQGVTLLVEEGPGSIDLSNRSEAEVERLREALHEAVHRMASVAGRLRLPPPYSEAGVRADGDYLAECLPQWRELAAAPSPDDRGGERRITTAHRVTEHDGEVVVEPPIKPGLSIYLDRQLFTVQGNGIISEAELRDLPVARVPADFEIWLEQPNQDVRIGKDAIPLRGGERFYTTPRQIQPGAADQSRETPDA